MKYRKKHIGTNLSLPAIILISLLFSGCAGQRWTGPLAEEEQTGITAKLAAMQKLEKECSDSIDADALIFGESPVEEWRVAGYLQLFPPSFIKFVITNPLGQPVYAFASNGKTYQSLDPGHRRHTRGKIRSMAIRKNMPLSLVQADWFAYLTGRLPARSLEIVEINEDASGETVWLQLSPAVPDRTGESVWLHLDPVQGAVLGYLFLDGAGKTLAEISYGDKQGREDHCTPHRELLVTGLTWGATIRVQLQEISSDRQFSTEDFSLPVPKGYTTQRRP